MAETTTVTAGRRALGAQLAAYRNAAGYSQQTLAIKVAYARSSVANVEAGRQCAATEFWEACDDVLGAGGALVEDAARVESLRTVGQRTAAAEARRARAGLIDQRSAPVPAAPPASSAAPPAEVAASSVIHGAFATVAEHLGELDDATDDSIDLKHRVLSAYRQNQAPDTGRPLTLTLVGGYAGSGKSEFARFLSAVTGWSILDKDTISRPLVEQLLLAYGSEVNDRHTPTYINRIRPLEYRALVDAGLENLAAGVSTVLTAPFLKEFADKSWITRLQNRCAAHGASLAVIWVRCDIESMYDYISFRGAARDTWKLTNWDDYLADVDPHFEPAGPFYIVDNHLNAATAIADQAREIAAKVRATEGVGLR